MTTPSPSEKRTITDKAVDAGFRRLSKLLEAEYQKRCPWKPASKDWFERLDRAEVKLHELLAVRPLSRADVNATIDRAFKALRSGLREERSKQPKMVEQVHIATGARKMVPKEEE